MQTFFSDDDYRDYIALIAASCRQYEVDIWAYCLMPNHVHLIAVPMQPDSFRHATETAGKEALQTVGRLVSKQRKRLKKEVRALDVDSDSPDAEAALHEVRKSAKRLRYAAEAAAPIFGKRATTLARAAEEIQESLGDHHDSVVTRELLRELAANHRGKSAFTYGRLHALEQGAGEESRERFFRTWSSSPPGPLRWK